MLTQQTLDKLHDMKLTAMANAFTEQLGQPDLNELSLKTASPCWWTGNGPLKRTGA
jgi:hypothetical protein